MKIKKGLKDWFRLEKEIGSFVWSPKVVFIRYFVVLPILVLIIWLIVR